MEKVKWVRTCRFTHSFLHMSRLLRIPSVVKTRLTVIAVCCLLNTEAVFKIFL